VGVLTIIVESSWKETGDKDRCEWNRDTAGVERDDNIERLHRRGIDLVPATLSATVETRR
jgi:hypothetical protein